MGKDPYLGLLNIRNTPGENMDNPTQIMFNRITNMSIPSINISNKTNITQVNTATDRYAGRRRRGSATTNPKR